MATGIFKELTEEEVEEVRLKQRDFVNKQLANVWCFEGKTIFDPAFKGGIAYQLTDIISNKDA